MTNKPKMVISRPPIVIKEPSCGSQVVSKLPQSCVQDVSKLPQNCPKVVSKLSKRFNSFGDFDIPLIVFNLVPSGINVLSM